MIDSVCRFRRTAALLLFFGVGLALTGGATMSHSLPAAASDSIEKLQQTDQKPGDNLAVPGTIRGNVIDGNGHPVAAAQVKLSNQDSALNQQIESDDDGVFVFSGVAPGPFQLVITCEGFVKQTYSGTLHSEENLTVAPIGLVLASSTTEVHVSMSPIEIAQEEMKDEEKQRVLGVVPNFYVTYDPAAPPLTPKQKFELAWKETVDPINLGLTAAIAGIEQATDAYNGFGQGGDGYAKRFGAGYADLATSTLIGSAILPVAFKQDPRYFYRGTGSVRSRVVYAISRAVICKGDNGNWQTNYSGLLGGLAAAGISSLYYPTERSRAAETFENAAIGVGTSAAANLLQEFLIRKLTPHAPKYSPRSP